MNTIYIKLQVLEEFFKEVDFQKQKLINELVVNANNNILKIRRCRMLSQLAMYESRTVQKILNFESDNFDDYFVANFREEIAKVVNRSA